MKYETIINGKKVKFEIKREFSKVPYNEALSKLANNALKSTKDNNVAQICRSFLARDAENFYGHCRKIIENKLIEVMKVHPELITSDNFEIEVTYSSEINGFIGEYNRKLSSINKVCFIFYLLQLFEYFLFHGESSIANTVYHEFAHHLDRNFSRKIDILHNRIKNSVENNNYASHYTILSLYIIKIFESIRNEAISTFFGYYKSKRVIFFRNMETKLLEELELLLDKNASAKNLLHSFEHGAIPYQIGESMTGIIILDYLVKKGKGNLVWITLKGRLFRLFGKKEADISQIKHYYGKKEFELHFQEDSEIDKIVYKTLNEIKKLSHIGFIKVYESACLELGCNPIISWDLYKYYRKKYWEIGQKKLSQQNESKN